LWDIEALFGRQTFGQIDLEALESAVRRQVLSLAARAVEQRSTIIPMAVRRTASASVARQHDMPAGARKCFPAFSAP
jgi:hypothetical protein